ncbi:S49 family peptidase [Sulfurivirga sp.]|uniref:S49 family peptidase n=1 Tax=Sulfurivirga sp. TaxID=2614236 RepID=UPI0026000A73|nr:S49 family peptidase [Sulfurivirga sp.]
MSNSKPFEALARLFRRRRGGDFVELLHSRALNTPLAVHADVGAAIVAGWLRPESVAALGGEAEEDSAGILTRIEREEGGAIAVLDISGPLVSRPTGFCSPLSYGEIREAFDAALNDASVGHIVLRIDSPGGEVAGLFDLADHIFEAREQKLITAVVDDMAASAAYAIASSASQVLVSRTGVVGSVGVVSYHIDQSGLNERMGVKVEYIYAGEHKVDGNPHQPLSDEARTRFQAEVDDLYEMFVALVARNRNLDAEAVRATEAATFRGVKAISTGFADAIVPFAEAMDIFMRGGPESKPAAPAPAADAGYLEVAAQDDDTRPQVQDAPAVEDGTQAEPEADPQDQARYAATVRALCTAAGVPEAAEDFIAAGVEVEQVRADLMELVATDGPEIQSARSSDLVAAEDVPRIDPAVIYSKRNGGLM